MRPVPPESEVEAAALAAVYRLLRELGKRRLAREKANPEQEPPDSRPDRDDVTPGTPGNVSSPASLPVRSGGQNVQNAELVAFRATKEQRGEDYLSW